MHTFCGLATKNTEYEQCVQTSEAPASLLEKVFMFCYFKALVWIWKTGFYYLIIK